MIATGNPSLDKMNPHETVRKQCKLNVFLNVKLKEVKQKTVVSRKAVESQLSVQFSHSVMSHSLWPYGLQHTRLPCPSPTPRFYSFHVHGVGDTIQPSHPLSSPSPPAISLSQHHGLFKWVISSHQGVRVSASTSALPMTIQDWFPLGICTFTFMYCWSLAWRIHYFTSVWDECNCAVVWAFFGIAFLWDWNKKWSFPVL